MSEYVPENATTMTLDSDAPLLRGCRGWPRNRQVTAISGAVYAGIPEQREFIRAAADFLLMTPIGRTVAW